MKSFTMELYNELMDKKYYNNGFSFSQFKNLTSASTMGTISK